MMRKAVLFFLLIISVKAFSQQETILPVSEPVKVALSASMLSKVDTLMQRYVDQKKLPGIVTMVARHGKVVSFRKYGAMGNGKPMKLDAIFRIASMTKPITSVAVMMLYDEGRFQLDDPVLEQIRDEIKNLDINNLTPVEALNKLNEVKRIITGK